MDRSVKDLSANDFYKWFNEQFYNIEQHIKTLKPNEEKSSCTQEISALTSECRNIRHHLSSHDQKLYSDQLQKLTEMIEINEDKPKFSFRKRGKVLKENIISSDSAAPYIISNNESLSLPVSAVPASDFSTSPSISAPPPTYHVTNKTNQLITNNKPTSPLLQISNIINSIITLHHEFNSAKLDHITASIIFIPSIQGPIYASNITNSIIIANCHQFRIHKSSDLNLFLSCRSKRPIIEHCFRLGFGQYPPTLSETSSIEITNWTAIDDFNWIRKTQSINWFEIANPPNFEWLLNLPSELNDTTQANLNSHLTAIKTLCIDK